MQSAPIHPAEELRLRSVHSLGLLDTPDEARFDRLTDLAALVVGVPIALISLVDRDRQWFKSRAGFDATQTERDISFCGHAIAADLDSPFVVEDTLTDARFADNPLVTGEPHIRFYAGQLLRDADGLPVGTLCVIDHRPRALEPVQQQALTMIAKLVEDELNRRAEHELTAALVASEKNKSLILDTVTQGLVLQDEHGAVVQWNPAAEQLMGLKADEITRPQSDDPWETVRADGSPWPLEDRPAMVALRTALPVSGQTMGLRYPDGRVQWMKVNARPVVDDDGLARQVVTTFVDVTSEVHASELRVELEEALRRSEHTARVSLDALEQGVLLADPAGIIHRVNPAAKQILGYTEDELAALLFSPEWKSYDQDGSLLSFADRPLVRAVMGRVPVVGQIVGWERKNGARVMVRVSCIPNADQAGGVVIAFTDITTEHLAGRLLDATFRAAPVGLAVLDTDRSILRCNLEFAHQTGRSADDLIGMDAMELVHPDDRAAATQVGMGLRLGGVGPNGLEQRVCRPDNTEVWVNTHLAVIPDRQQPLAIAATFDVTERRRMVLELSRFSYLFLHANDLIAVVDADGHQLFVSPSAQRVLGYPDEFYHPDGILGIVHADDMEATIHELSALIANTRGPEPFTVRVHAYNGDIRYMECVGVNLLDEPAVGGVVITARDVTERVQLSEQLAHRALHDTLTDLPNRQLFETTLRRALSRTRRDNTLFGLCFIDLDGFKGVNDTHGHAAGDGLIVSVAERIRSAIRDGDLPARVGGDEFVVVLDSVTGPEQALAAAARLRDALVEDSADEPGPHCGASIGLAISRPDDTVSSLLNRADAAMYKAKAQRRSKVELAVEDAVFTTTQ